MKVAQIPKPNAALKLSSASVPEPKARQVRIKVQACGVCHSDMLTVVGAIPGIQYPRVPGHEVVGLIDAVGADVPDWKKGMRVGVGWHGGHCGHCISCRRGDFITCKEGKIPGISYDGGYAEYMIAPFEALASIPDELKSEDAAPLLCAGITTFNSLRHSGALAGRSGRSTGHRRTRPPRRAVREQDGIQDRGDCARGGQGTVGQEAGRSHLPRQHPTECGGGTDQAGRSESDSRDRDGLRRA